ncbi:MAG TPA: hypothetical protein VFK80_07460 [Limnochordia bacterium]|nr:hypothetical protein [Limnochordia bacterium]
MNLLSQLNPWLNRPVRVDFVDAPPREGRLAAVHTDYLTLSHHERLLHCPIGHINSLRRRLSAAPRAVSADLAAELSALPATFAEWLEGAAGAWVEFNTGGPGEASGRLEHYDGFGFDLEEKDEIGYHAAPQIRWIGRRAEPSQSPKRP